MTSTPVVASLRARGAELVGEVEHHEDSYRLCPGRRLLLDALLRVDGGAASFTKKELEDLAGVGRQTPPSMLAIPLVSLRSSPSSGIRGSASQIDRLFLREP